MTKAEADRFEKNPGFLVEGAMEGALECIGELAGIPDGRGGSGRRRGEEDPGETGA